jgi:hypothetical protein
MSHAFYNVLHLIGVFLLLLSLGGIGLHMINGGTREYPFRKWVAIFHGLGLLIIFVAGFGLMARLGMVGQGAWPFWIMLKLSIWLIMGVMPVLLYRIPKYSVIWVLLTFVFASLAAWTAINKPM